MPRQAQRLYKLRPFQREDVDIIKNNGLRALVASAPGTGKTGISLMAILETGRHSLPALVVCPSSVMHNWKKEARLWTPGLRVHIIDDMSSPIDKDANIYITSWALLDPRLVDLHGIEIRTVVADECFPAGTKVLSKHGHVPIETLRAGDEVWGEDVVSGERRWAKVTATQKKTTVEALVIVKHESGSFTCTANHKIWTLEEGYIRADRVCGHHLRVLRETGKESVDEPSSAEVLRQSMLGQVQEYYSGREGDAQKRRCRGSEKVFGIRNIPDFYTGNSRSFFKKDDRTQSNAGRRIQGEDERDVAENRTQADASGRERQTSFCPSETAALNAPESRTGTVLRCEQRAKETTELDGEQLRSGPGTSGNEAGNRDRRRESHVSLCTSSRPKKEQASYTSRVESVEIQKQGSNGGLIEGGCGDRNRDNSTDVYDIEVEGLHNYFAEGVLVSNCHLAKNPESLRSQALYKLTRGPKKGILLLSGTPIINSTAEMDVLHSLFDTTPVMIRRLLEDAAPDVPPKFRSYLYIRMRDRDQVEYDHAVEDFEEWLLREKRKLLETGAAQDAVDRALAAEAFVKVGYLRRLVGEAKAHAAADWATRAVRIGEPVVLFVEHQNVLLRLEKALRGQRVRYGVIEGKTPPKVRQQIVDDFQANKFPVIICTKAGKEGITLHAARHLLFVERFFTSAEEEQMEDRCIAQGQLVQTQKGLVPIEDISVGDQVLTHLGRWRKVTAKKDITVKARGFHRPPKRPLMTDISYMRFGEPLSCTYDHKLLVLRYEKWKQEVLEPEWVEAHAVQPQDFLCLPVPSENKDVDWIDFPEEARHDATTVRYGISGINGRFKPMPSRIALDTETLFFFGWYLAEGFSSTAKGKGRFVSLAAHERERPVLERIAKCLLRWDVNSSIYTTKGRGIEFRAFSAELAFLMLYLFGTGSTSKTLPVWILRLPAAKLQTLWDAYVQGDGYARNKQQEWRSVSSALGPQMALVAAKIGFRPTLRLTPGSVGCSPIWTGCVTRTGMGKGHLEVASTDYVFNPVKEVRTYGDKDRRVYDLSVEEDESFVVGHAAVHNCRRIGQKFPTTIWFLHAAGTIDDRLDAIVRMKRVIIRDAIGSETTAETAESNVEALIKSWNSFTSEKHETVDLGRGAPLPPLPSPSDTHAVVFYGDRWNTKSAARWCRMHGYLPGSRVDLTNRFKLVIHPIDVFKEEQFSVVPVCSDIRVIKGKRLSSENESLVRARLKRIQG